jgi:hypothetical protein
MAMLSFVPRKRAPGTTKESLSKEISGLYTSGLLCFAVDCSPTLLVNEISVDAVEVAKASVTKSEGFPPRFNISPKVCGRSLSVRVVRAKCGLDLAARNRLKCFPSRVEDTIPVS